MLLEQSSQGWSNADEVTIRFLGSKGHQEGQKLEKKRRKKEKMNAAAKRRCEWIKRKAFIKTRKQNNVTKNREEINIFRQRKGFEVLISFSLQY